jgi:hypothetical protein
MMFTVPVIVPYVCPMFNIWFEYLELLLLLLIAWICSLYLTLNILTVWPIYFNGQSRHFSWYMPLVLYLSVCAWCFNTLLIVFCVWKATLSCVFLKSLVICLTSFPQYVNVAHFVLWCFGSSCMFCFCGCDSGFSSRFVLYSFFCSMFSHSVFSICFYFFVIGHRCHWFSRYLIPDSLCSYGSHELLGIIILVCVGFLYIANSNLLSLQCIVMSQN